MDVLSLELPTLPVFFPDVPYQKWIIPCYEGLPHPHWWVEMNVPPCCIFYVYRHRQTSHCNTHLKQTIWEIQAWLRTEIRLFNSHRRELMAFTPLTELLEYSNASTIYSAERKEWKCSTQIFENCFPNRHHGQETFTTQFGRWSLCRDVTGCFHFRSRPTSTAKCIGQKWPFLTRSGSLWPLQCIAVVRLSFRCNYG